MPIRTCVVVATVAMAAIGTSQTNPNERLFRQAASEWPAAQAAAKKAGFRYTASELASFVPPSQNAASYYEKAFKMLRASSQDFHLPFTLDASSVASAKAILKSESPALAEIEKACELPHCSFAVRTFLGVQNRFPNAAGLKMATRLLCFRARIEAHDGNEAAAAADVGRVGHLMRHLMEQSALVEALVGVAIQAMAIATVDRIVTDRKGDRRCAKAMLDGLSKFPRRLDFQAIMPQERASVSYTLSIAYPEDGKGKPGKVDPSEPEATNQLITATKGIDPKVVGTAFRTRLLQFYTAAYKAAGDPALSDKGRLDKISALIEKESKGDATHDWNKIAVDLEQPWHVLLRYKALQEVTTLGLEQLANSKPGGIAEKARRLDSFTDKPLHYLLRPNGFVIYSVGLNMKDDHGRSDRPADDVVFEYPVPPPRGM